MTERPRMDDTSIYKDAAIGLAGVLGTIATWIAKKTVGKVEALDERKADKVDLTKLIDELREDRQAADESRQALHEKLNTVALNVARLEGSLGNR